MGDAETTSAAGLDTTNVPGNCRECGAELVNWERVHARKIGDVDYTIKMLQTEKIRHYFWHEHLDQWAINYARRKGKRQLYETVMKHLRKAVGPAQPFRDGWQTPFHQERIGKNVIYYGQHATATCCRRCAELWHGIRQGRELTNQELTYMADLVMRYIRKRLPDLAEEGIHVPPIRRKAKGGP